MTQLRTLFVAGFVLAGSLAYAADATDPDVIARQTLMKEIGGATKTLGDMAGGKTAHDQTAADAAKAVLAGHAAQIPALFEKNATDPASKAKPEIWTGWDGFIADAKALEDAAKAIDTSSADAIAAGMGGVGGACKACHTDYRS